MPTKIRTHRARLLVTRAQRTSASERGYNARWRKYRLLFLAEHPICGQCGRPANIVDHVIAHKGDDELFWAPNNHQPLCKPCHDRKTKREMSDMVETLSRRSTPP
jgi:5-methylcytosine-specific restriction protein A